MSIQRIVPLAFLLVLAAAVTTAGLIGHCGATGFLWWMNEEVASPLRGLVHMTEALPLVPAQIVVMIMLLAGVVGILGRHERFSLLANTFVVAALVYAIFFDWTDGAGHAAPHAVLMLGLAVALATTIYGHRGLIRAQLGEPATA